MFFVFSGCPFAKCKGVQKEKDAIACIAVEHFNSG